MPNLAGAEENQGLIGVGDDHPAERIDDLGVERLSREAQDLAVSVPGHAAVPVGAVGGHGFVGVGDGQDTGVEGDLAALQPAGVARAVPALVVGVNGREDVGTELQGAGTVSHEGIDPELDVPFEHAALRR
ncbi:hypothetical protein D3C72_1742270 [compost metagenome]